MALDADGLELLEVGQSAIPPVFRDSARVQDDLHALAAMAAKTIQVGRTMLDRVLVEEASVDAGGEDWLDLLAGDYGTGRQYGETNAVLRERMRTVPAGVIRSEVLALAQAIVDAASVSGTVAMVEMPRDQAHASEWVADGATNGGVFSIVSGKMRFTPTTPFAYPPCAVGLSGGIDDVEITFSGCASAGNDGTFSVEDIDGEGVIYTNASGVAESDATAVWGTERIEVEGGAVDGFAMAFADRGYRVWYAPGQASMQSLSGVIGIIPYGSTDAVRRSVQEMLRQRVAAGVVKLVEVRTTP